MALDFSINDAEAIRLIDIDDEGNVLSVVGKVKFTKDVEFKSYYTKSGQAKTEKMREGLFSDGTKTVKITFWAELVDLIKEQEMIQLYSATSKLYNEQIELSTNFSTSVCFLTEDLNVNMDIEHEEKDEDDHSQSMTCKRVIAVKIEEFHNCLFCKKKKLEPSSSIGMFMCPQCKREFIADFVNTSSTTMVCNLDIQPSNGDDLKCFTLFDQQISEIFGQMKENASLLKNHILSLKNFTIEFDSRKKNILTIFTEDL